MIVSLNADEDPGTPGTLADGSFITERDLNLLVLDQVGAGLVRSGVTTRWDRNENLASFIARVNSDGTNLAFAVGHNAGGGDYACTILCDAAGSDQAGNQLKCAETVGRYVATALGVGGPVLLHESLGVCCSTNMDGVFCEPLFMDNPTHQAIYHADVNAYASKCGEAIAHGICEAYSIAYVAPVTPPPPPPPAPDWKADFIGGPQTFSLTKPVEVVDLTTRLPISTVPAGPLAVAGTVERATFYVTQFALDKNQPHGLSVEAVHLATHVDPPPPPPPVDDDTGLATRLTALETWAKGIGFKG